MSDMSNDSIPQSQEIVARRNFFRKSAKVGLQVALGLFAFVPAAQALAKSNVVPNYAVCSVVKCNNYGQACQNIPFAPCHFYDSHNPSIFCSCETLRFQGC